MTEPKQKKTASQRMFDRYKTYEGPRGNADEWRGAAAGLAAKEGAGEALKDLGLATMPADLGDLKKARRAAMQTAHPDKGGSTDGAASINAAFEKLARRFAKAPEQAVQTGIGPIEPPRCTATLPSTFGPTEVAEIKFDGSRYLLYLGFDPYGLSSGSRLLSRHISKVTKRFVDKTENVPHITSRHYDHQGTVLDGEMFLTDWKTTQGIMGAASELAVERQRSNKMTYHVFDMPFLKGKDIRALPYEQRRLLLAKAIAEINNPQIVLVEQFTTGIDEAFARVTAAGGEGLIVKKLSGAYGQGWAKFKKSADVSCVVTGFKDGKGKLAGLIGAIEVSVFEGGRLQKVGWAAGFTNAVLEEITANKSAYLGRVVDVFAQEISSDDQLRHPTFHRFRDDVSADDCTLAKLKDDLKKVKGSREK